MTAKKAAPAERPAERVPPDGAELGVLADSFGSVFRMLRNHLATRIVVAFEPFGLRTGSFSTMALIAANPGCAQSDISRELGSDKSVIVALIDELEKRGLAERTRSSVDRRRNALSLTPAGEALFEEMRAAAEAVERPIREALSAEEAEQLLSLGRRALVALRT